MPTSSSDDELASRFSAFVSEIIRIRNEIDAAVVNREFSVDFPLRFTRYFTFFHFRLVTEADFFEIHEGNKKNMLFTRSYQCLKAW